MLLDGMKVENMKVKVSRLWNILQVNFPLSIEISKSRKVAQLPLCSIFNSSSVGKKIFTKFTTIIQGAKVVNKSKSTVKSSTSELNYH